MSESAAHHRNDERAELRRLLLSGESVLMLAPRRIGKTWLMKRVAEDLVTVGVTCIYIDVEGMQSEEEFLRALCGAIEKKQELLKRVTAHLSQKFKQLTSGVSEATIVQIVGKVDHKLFLETLIESLNQSEARAAILIDEF